MNVGVLNRHVFLSGRTPSMKIISEASAGQGPDRQEVSSDEHVGFELPASVKLRYANSSELLLPVEACRRRNARLRADLRYKASVLGMTEEKSDLLPGGCGIFLGNISRLVQTTHCPETPFEACPVFREGIGSIILTINLSCAYGFLRCSSHSIQSSA